MWLFRFCRKERESLVEGWRNRKCIWAHNKYLPTFCYGLLMLTIGYRPASRRGLGQAAFVLLEHDKVVAPSIFVTTIKRSQPILENIGIWPVTTQFHLIIPSQTKRAGACVIL
jgi:hypothetical protein